MKTLLALTTTVLSLAVLTGCKKETYGDPMKFAQKYFLEEIMSPGYKALGGFATKILLKDLMRMQGYTGFKIINARLTSTPLGEDIVECTVGIKTSGTYKYYRFEESLYPYRVGVRNGIHASPLNGEGKEKWVSHLEMINNEYPTFYKPISTPPTFTVCVARRQIDGIYVPICRQGRRLSSSEKREKEAANWMWDFQNDNESFSTNFVITSKQLKAVPRWFIKGTTEQIQAYNSYSQRVMRAELLCREMGKKQRKLYEIDCILGNNGWRRVEGEERIKLEKEQKEVMQTRDELKKQVLTL